jgi:acyl-CoA oxidase
MAGETATHTVAICRLMVDGRDHGLNWFIIPLRSLEDGTLLPGVTCGDVGAKMGRQGLDNGWLQFSQVRVPRNYMLMKWAQLSPDVSPQSPIICMSANSLYRDNSPLRLIRILLTTP